MLKIKTSLAKFSLYGILCCLAVFMPSGGASAADTVTIVLFGDSLIAGPYIAEEEKIHTQLQKQLQTYGLQTEVVNAGVNGETSAGGVTRIDNILKLEPDLVILALGANDMLRNIDPKQTYDNLNKIINQLITKGRTRVMLAGIMAMPNKPQEYQDKFNIIYPSLAQRYSSIEFFPFLLKDVALVAEMNLPDGLHPNGKGAAKIAENITPYVFRVFGYYDKK